MQIQIAVRYALNFSFYGGWNRPRTNEPGCENQYFNYECTYAPRIIGIERQQDVEIYPEDSNELAGPFVLTIIIADLILLVFLCIHRTAMERSGIWE